MSFIFADGWWITMNDRREVLERGSVCVENDRIAAVAPASNCSSSIPGQRSWTAAGAS